MGSFLSDTFFKSFSSKYCNEFKMYRKENKSEKDTSNFKLPNLCGNQFFQHLAAFVFDPSVFGEKFSTAEF